jgi:tetratricopeptide (TPR) repeat protein
MKTITRTLETEFSACTSLRTIAGSRMSVRISASVVALFLLIPCSEATATQKQSSKSEAKFPQVQTLIEQGRLEEAKSQIQEELRKDPTSVDAYVELGVIESSEGEFTNAVAAFEKALHLAPNSTKAHNDLGNVYLNQKKVDLAEKEFRTVLRLDPANRDGNYNLGVLLMAKGSPAEAITHFERVRPTDVATTFNLITACFQSKRTAEALRMATELSSQNKSDVKVHFNLGVLLASQAQYKFAQVEFEKADALQPGTFEILFNLGQTLLRNGNNTQAELVLTRAMKLKPDSSELLYMIAQVYSNESRPLDALDLLLRAHKIAPENPDIILLMAQISMSQNYYEDAIPLLEAGLKVAPQRPDLLAALGQSYFMSGKADKAIEVFKQLLEVDHSARSYAYLGLSYRNLGRFDEAKQAFQTGLKLDPHSSSCLFNLGYIAERQGDAALAESMFQQALHANPDYADALLELANLRITEKKYTDAQELLRRYVKVSHSPATGYYKLAMVERNLHETAAADRDLGVFQTLSKNVSAGPYPYEHLFDYIDNRSKLAPGVREQLDITELNEQIKKHPDQPEDLYLLAEAYLKAGRAEDAKTTVAQLDKISAGDFRTLTGTGVLLARYHLYDDAIQHFQTALQVNPVSDEVKFDLANAYFRKRLYPQALDAAGTISAEGQKDNAYLALLGDIYAHLGDTARAEEIFRSVISRNPDNDQGYLSLSLLQFRTNDIKGAKETLLQGQARIPASGKILWGLGVASVLEGNTAEAAQQFERAVEMLPEWPGSYSMLGVFYFQTGQIAKAKEVLSRFKNSSANSVLDVNRIEQVLAQAPETNSAGNEPMTMASRAQMLQLALSLADRTL